MTFAFPVALAALTFVPPLLLAYLLVQRRRSRYALRFTNLPLLANVVDATPRWRRHLPAMLALAVPHGSDRRSGATADRRRRATQGRHGHPRDRPLRLDAGDRRDTLADGSRTIRRGHVHQRSPERIQGRPRLVLRPGRRRHPPTADHDAARQGPESPSGRQRHRDRRRNHPLRRPRSHEPRHEDRRERRHPSSSFSSRTGPARPATRRRSRPRPMPRPRRSPFTRSHSAPTRARSRSPTADGQERLYRVPPDPATLSAVADTTGGSFSKPRTRSPSRASTAASARRSAPKSKNTKSRPSSPA